MKRIARIVFKPALPVLLLFTSLAGITSFAQEPAHQPGQMTLWQARRTIVAAVEGADIRFCPTCLGGTDIRFSSDSFEYDSMNSKKVSKQVRIDLVTPPAVVTKCGKDRCELRDEAGHYADRSLPKSSETGSFLIRNWYDPGSNKSSCLLCDPTPVTCSADCVHAAESFAAAFNALRAFAKDPNAPLRTFTQRAAAWRALATKPPIPDEVRVQRMMAEDAFKANKPDEALHYYETGIQLYPTWPEGNFNAALIAGDLGYYAAAIEHMQAYLELVPDAPDAQAARDKILIWQTKAKEK
jgi:hypothetical protein